MAIIAYSNSKFESMIKKPIVTYHDFYTSITFSKRISFKYINSIVIDRSRTKIFPMILKRLISQQFLLDKGFFSESFYTQRNFPCKHCFLAPRDQKGVKKVEKLPMFLKRNPQIQHSCTCRYF